MKKPISFHPDVADDIKGSFNWYENQLQGLGKQFLDELENAYIAIQNFPQSWANFHYGFKRYILNKFPFSIVYKESDEQIFVIVVMHNSRKPYYWEDRLK